MRRLRPIGMKVAILRANAVAPDPRVEKVVAALLQLGATVAVYCWNREGKTVERSLDPRVSVHEFALPASFGSGLLNASRMLRWNAWLVRQLLRSGRKYDVLHACDLDCVLPALLAKALKGTKVVYDIFDFFADSRNLRFGALRAMFAGVERACIRCVDAVILPTESRMEQVGERWLRGRKVVFIHNTPSIDRSVLATRDEIDRPGAGGPIRLVFVGSLLRDRSLENVTKWVESRDDIELIVAGFGELEPYFSDPSRGKNVSFLGVVPYRRALELTVSADVLFAAYDPSIPNHRYSAPNKLYEAMALGVPIVVAKDTNIDRIVEENALGAVVTYGDEHAFIEAVRRLGARDAESRRAFAERVRALFESRYSWKVMEERLTALYTSLG